MAFSGMSTNKYFTPNLIGEDISDVISTLTPYEAPFLDWLGDPDGFATSTKHEFIEDFMRPRTIINSTAINSATAATGVQDVGIEMLTQALGDEPPGDCRAGDAGNQQQDRFAVAVLAAITQVMLADTIGLNVAAMNERAHAATSDFSG